MKIVEDQERLDRILHLVFNVAGDAVEGRIALARMKLAPVLEREAERRAEAKGCGLAGWFAFLKLLHLGAFLMGRPALRAVYDEAEEALRFCPEEDPYFAAEALHCVGLLARDLLNRSPMDAPDRTRVWQIADGLERAAADFRPDADLEGRPGPEGLRQLRGQLIRLLAASN